MAGVKVVRSDSTFIPWSADTPVHACRVAMEAPDGFQHDVAAKINWADSTLRDWRAITSWDAEGPDGFSRIFVRAGVRCLIELQQDGGDDSDSTYVPSALVTEQTSCWPDSSGVTPRDTA